MCKGHSHHHHRHHQDCGCQTSHDGHGDHHHGHHHDHHHDHHGHGHHHREGGCRCGKGDGHHGFKLIRHFPSPEEQRELLEKYVEQLKKELSGAEAALQKLAGDA